MTRTIYRTIYMRKNSTSFLTAAAAIALLSGCVTDGQSLDSKYSTNTNQNETVSQNLVPQGSLAAQGAYYDKQGDHMMAQKLYRQALVENPSDINIRNNMGLSLLLDGKTEEAAAVLQSVVNDPQATPQHRNNLALAYGLMNRDNAARLLLERDLKPYEVDQNLGLYNALRQDPSKLSRVIFPSVATKEGRSRY